jgi:hypothetical protein
MVNVGFGFGNLNYLDPGCTPRDTLTKNMVIEDNIVDTLGAPWVRLLTPLSSFWLTMHRQDSITFRHNTTYSYPTSGPYTLFNADPPPGGGFHAPGTYPTLGGQNLFNDNIFDKHESSGQRFIAPNTHCQFLQTYTGFGGTTQMKKNVFIDTGSVADDCSGGTGSAYPAGTVTSFSAITDVLEDPAAGDFRVKAAATAAKGTATDGLDIGANAELVGWATAGAVSGAINDFLNFRIQPVTTVTTSGATIRFTAPNTGAVTWTVSTSRAMGSTVGSTGQSRVGLAGVATITGLSSNTRYWARATDGSSRWLDVEFTTR